MKYLAAILLLTAFAFAQHSATIPITQSPSGGVTGNNYYRSSVSGGPYSLLPACTFKVPTLSCTDTTVLGGQTYYYVITAMAAGDNPSESGYSNEVKAVIPGDQPKPPVAGQPTQVSQNPPMVQETWALSTAPNIFQQYIFRQGPTSTAWNQQRIVKPNISSYTDASVKKGKSYAYEIVAADRQGHMLGASQPSATITVK